VVSINLAELEAPFSDRLIAESDTAHRQHLFNIAEAEGEAEVQPHGMTDDLGRESDDDGRARRIWASTDYAG